MKVNEILIMLKKDGWYIAATNLGVRILGSGLAFDMSVRRDQVSQVSQFTLKNVKLKVE